MVLCTKVGGIKTKRTEEVVLSMPMEMSMMETGSMIKLMALVYTAILTEQSTKDSGKKINNTEKV
jgi:hypothetical protein